MHYLNDSVTLPKDYYYLLWMIESLPLVVHFSDKTLYSTVATKTTAREHKPRTL